MSIRGSARRESVCNSLDEKQKHKEKISLKENEKQNQKFDKEKYSGELDKEFTKFKSEFKELFQEFDEQMDKKLSKLDQKFAKAFDELKREMGLIRVEVSDTKEDVKELKSRVAELEGNVNFYVEHQDEVKELQDTKLMKLNQVMDEMKKKLLMMEKFDRKYNLLFYGFTEEHDEDLNTKMRTFFKDKLNLSTDRVEKMQFTSCHRTPYEGQGPKPIIIRFLSFDDRELVYSKFLMPVLRDERKRILSDLPVEMKKTRAALAKEAYKIRREEHLKTRIIEKGLSVYLEVRRTSEDSWRRRDV